MAKKPETIQRDRDAGSGQFKPTGGAKKHPTTAIVDTMPAPSHGKKK